PLLRIPLHGAARAAAKASVATTDSADSVASTDAAPTRRRGGWPVNQTNGRRNMTTTETNPIDEARLEAFVGQAVTDMGAAISGLLLHIGDRLRLYKASGGGRARPKKGEGGRGAAHVGRAGRPHRHRGALRPRVARQPGGRRLRDLRPGR